MRVRYGTSMRDILSGSADADEMYGYEGNDDLWGEAGNDLLYGGLGDDKLVGGEGADLLDGGDGTADLASYEDAKAGVYVRLDTGAGYTGAAAGDVLIGIEHLRGTIYADFLVGDGNFNRIEGGRGDDIVFGLGGIDLLYGGDGNDHIWGGTDWDYIYGGEGFDYVRFDYASERVDVRLERPILTGTGGGWAGESFGDSYWEIEGVVGSSFDDFIEGNSPVPGTTINANNVLIGLGGNDEIYRARRRRHTLWRRRRRPARRRRGLRLRALRRSRVSRLCQPRSRLRLHRPGAERPPRRHRGPGRLQLRRHADRRRRRQCAGRPRRQ